MFTWLAILHCHLVCVCGKSYEGEKISKKENIRSPNDAWKGYLKSWNWWNSQSFQRHCPLTPQGGFTPPHMNLQLQGVLVLTHVIAIIIKLNPSWKIEVSKSAWIKPWSISYGFPFRSTSWSTLGFLLIQVYKNMTNLLQLTLLVFRFFVKPFADYLSLHYNTPLCGCFFKKSYIQNICVCSMTYLNKWKLFHRQ